MFILKLGLYAKIRLLLDLANETLEVALDGILKLIL